jgi:hypothetical protein
LSKSHGLVAAAVAAPLAWLFAPAMTGGSSFAFRDAAHFYHPLFEFIHDQWRSGRIPLWNPDENLGQPIVGDATSSVFYPGKLIFALPLDYTLLYNLYIVGHVVLAAALAYRLARHFNAGVAAAGLGAVAYAFSGSVLFQYCNVVFLVGAAWLPLALELTDVALARRSAQAAAGLGAVLALMITGGEPQMAYNALLVAGLYALVLRCGGHPHADTYRATRCRSAPALLAIAAVTATGLAAIQILPAWQAARRSARAAYDSPRNVYELATAVARPSDVQGACDDRWWHGIVGANARGHQRSLYDFSVGPWRAIELLWPNISGQEFPTSHRWLRALPAEGRTWTPSLYFGLLPLALAATTFSVRRRAPLSVQWLSWMVILSTLASFGVYGTVWMVREVTHWCGLSLNGPVGDEVGGLYWLFNVLLPGYVYFRYPAKLLVIATLGMSILAARGGERLSAAPPRWLPRAMLALSAASVALLAAASALRERLCAWWQSIPPDPRFGPFDCGEAWADLGGGLWQTALVAVLAWWLLRGAPPRKWLPAALLVVTAIDLAAAQAPLIAYAPSDAWHRMPGALSALGTRPSSGRLERLPVAPELRFYRNPDCHVAAWRRAGSSDRLRAGLAWDQDTLLPKYNLTREAALVESWGTLAPYDMHVFWDAARRHAGNRSALPHASVLDLTGARVALVPESEAANGIHIAEDVVMIRRTSALPRAWIVHDAEILPALQSRSPRAVERRTEEVLFPGGQPRDWKSIAVVESDASLLQDPRQPPSNARESCAVVFDDPQRIEIDVMLAAPGLLVLADAFDPGWTLSQDVAGRLVPLPIRRTNRVMRGVELPAGNHHLVFEYRPAGFLAGAIASGLSVAALVAWGLTAALRRSRTATGGRRGHATVDGGQREG